MLTKIQRPRKELSPCSLREPFHTKTGWYIEPFVDGDGNEFEKATRGNIVQWFKVGD